MNNRLYLEEAGFDLFGNFQNSEIGWNHKLITVDIEYNCCINLHKLRPYELINEAIKEKYGKDHSIDINPIVKEYTDHINLLKECVDEINDNRILVEPDRLFELYNSKLDNLCRSRVKSTKSN